MSKFPLEVWSMSTKTSIDSSAISNGTERLNSDHIPEPSSISVPGRNGPKLAFISAPLLVQFSASPTAAPASTAPNPYL